MLLRRRPMPPGSPAFSWRSHTFPIIAREHTRKSRNIVNDIPDARFIILQRNKITARRVWRFISIEIARKFICEHKYIYVV